MHAKESLRLTPVLRLVSLAVWDTQRPLLARVRFCSEDFGRANSDYEPSVGYAIHYKISHERNFVMRIFVKRGLTVHFYYFTI
jgi:hypothetical protein